MTIEELLLPESHDKVDKLSKAQLQIVLLCPTLASKLSELKTEVSNADNLFKNDKVLVMLLGVDREEILSDKIKGLSNFINIQLYNRISIHMYV